jgi:tryptophan-rich sensory protein
MSLLKRLPNPGRLVIAVGVTHTAGLIGSVFTTKTVSSWYPLLVKPEFSPPSWIFAPVWLALYTLMGIAAYLVWQKWREDSESRVPLVVYFIHLVLNSFWSIVFFGFKDPATAFAVIIVLWINIAYLVIAFFRVYPRAGYLLVPYLLWVSFAAALNYHIWILN